MTVDPTALRVIARGNHKRGYRGVIEIRYFTVDFAFECGDHQHETTSVARDCIRRRVWRLLDADEIRRPIAGVDRSTGTD